MSGQTIIRLNRMFVPQISPSDYADGEFCIRVSGEWMSFLMGLLAIFKVRAFWENTTEQEWQQIVLWVDELSGLVGICSGVASTAQIQQVQQPPTIIAGESGITGLTIEELEGIAIMSITDIAWIDGKLNVKIFGCCDWIAVKSIAEISSITSSKPPVITNKPPTSITSAEWDDLGQPQIPDIPGVGHSDPTYTTDDSIRCAKATALVNTLRDTWTVLDDAFLALAGAGTWGAAEIVAALVAAGLSGGWLIAAGVAASIAAVIVDEGLIAMDEEVDSWTDADWDNMICHLSGACYPGSTIVDIDIDQMIKSHQINVAQDTTGEHWTRAIMRTFPVYYWKELTQQDVADTDCGCNDFKPFVPGSGLPGQVSWYTLFGNQNISSGSAVFAWGDNTATVTGDSTSPDHGTITRTFSVPKVIAHAGKKLIVDLQTRTVVGTVPSNEFYVQFSFSWYDITGGGAVQTYTSATFGVEALNEIDLTSYFSGIGVAGANIEVRSLSFFVKNAFDAGESGTIILGDIKIADNA